MMKGRQKFGVGSLNDSRILFLVAVWGIMMGAAYGQFGLPIDKLFQGDKEKKESGGGPNIQNVGGISLKEELDIGGSLAIEIAAKQGGVLKNEALTRRVALIGKALVLYSTRPQLPWTFMVLNNSNVNAFSCPGGYVFVTKGLLDTCTSDAQIAGVLAHEICHVTGRHALKIVAGKETAGLGGEALGIIGSLAGAPDIPGLDSMIGGLGKTIIDKGYGPGREAEADKGGTQLLYDTGFPPPTLRDYLAKLKTEQETFPTHPSTEKRVQIINEYMEENGLVSGN